MAPDRTGCRTAVLRGSVPREALLAKYVDVPKYLGFCRECPNYGRWWSCPPYDFDPMEIWGAYDRLELLAMQIVPETPEAREKALSDPRGLLAPFRSALDAALEQREAAFPGSRRLNAGKCLLCPRCARDEGRPCRRSGEMRWSIESLGGAVGAMAEEILHTPLRWAKDGQPPEYFLLVGGLLCREGDHA